MDEEKNSLKIPFLLLPYNLQCTIARKLSADTFHRLAIASKFIQEFKNWVLPCDLCLFVGKPYFIYRIFTDTPKLYSCNYFEPLCSIKFRSILVESDTDLLQEFVQCLRSPRRIYTDKLTIFGRRENVANDGLLYVDLIQLLKPKNLLYSSFHIPSSLMNFFSTYQFNELVLDDQPELAELFKSLKFISFSSDCKVIPPMDIVRVIEQSISGERSQDTELLLFGLTENSKFIIFFQLKDRLSLLYSPGTHELSIWSAGTKRSVTHYILFSKFSVKSLWLLSEYYNLLKFRKIAFSDLEEGPGYL